MTHLRINRRTLLTGTVALGTVGLLAACGGGSDKKISGKAASSTEEIVKNLEINKQDRSSLKQGGEFRGSVSAIGPNFNILTPERLHHREPHRIRWRLQHPLRYRLHLPEPRWRLQPQR